MKITDLLDFQIMEDSIRCKTGMFYFFRIIPPNLSILNPGERRMKIEGFKGLLNSTEVPLQIFAMDKSEDLSKNKAFWKKTPERYAAISDAILNEITDIESTSSGIQRAYYFVIKPKEQQQVILFENLLTETGFRFHRADRSELITVMNNFLLRSFIEFDIYTLEQEVQMQYESQKVKK